MKDTNLIGSPKIVRPIKTRRLKWTGHVARINENRSAFKILIGTSKEKSPLGRRRCRWKDNKRICRSQYEEFD